MLFPLSLFCPDTLKALRSPFPFQSRSSYTERNPLVAQQAFVFLINLWTQQNIARGDAQPNTLSSRGSGIKKAPHTPLRVIGDTARSG